MSLGLAFDFVADGEDEEAQKDLAEEGSEGGEEAAGADVGEGVLEWVVVSNPLVTVSACRDLWFLKGGMLSALECGGVVLRHRNQYK